MSIPIPWAINIKPPGPLGPARYDPATLDIAVGDQVHWANNDTNPHWPALLFNGRLNKVFFMPNQIAPNSSSTNWTPSGPGTYAYECSLHPNERGTIVVK
jgi:plastocyanin